MAKEYIEREAAIKALQNHYEVRNAVQNGIMDECVMLMMRVPAADVVPVVRCGECKHWFDNGTDLCSCDRDALLRRRDFFCADGVREDGDGE